MHALREYVEWGNRGDGHGDGGDSAHSKPLDGVYGNHALAATPRVSNAIFSFQPGERSAKYFNFKLQVGDCL